MSSIREISYLLSHLASVLQNLEPAWSLAFLNRARFLDPVFFADVLATISKFVYLIELSIILRSSSYDLRCPSNRKAITSNYSRTFTRPFLTIPTWIQCHKERG